jgi:hypothetical protein
MQIVDLLTIFEITELNRLVEQNKENLQRAWDEYFSD